MARARAATKTIFAIALSLDEPSSSVCRKARLIAVTGITIRRAGGVIPSVGGLPHGAVHPVVIDRLPLAAAREVHARIDAGGFGGKIVLLPWPAS
jgi:hypothetical protein